MKITMGIVAIVTTIAICGAVAQAQQPKKVPRIGYVSGTGDAKNPGPNVEAFRKGCEISVILGKKHPGSVSLHGGNDGP